MWKKEFNANHLRENFSNIAGEFREVRASVESIPTRLEGRTPHSPVKSFDHVTLDLKWACMYNELHAFEQITKKLANIHLHSSLQRDKWTLDDSTISFYEILRTIREEWKCSGILTVEPEGLRDSSSPESLLKAMRPLRT